MSIIIIIFIIIIDFFPLLHNSNNIWWQVKFMKLYIMQFYPISYFFQL